MSCWEDTLGQRHSGEIMALGWFRNSSVCPRKNWREWVLHCWPSDLKEVKCQNIYIYIIMMNYYNYEIYIYKV